MRDQDRIQSVALLVDGGEPRQKIAFAQSGVHQDARAPGTNEGGITRATAGEHTDFDDDAPPKFIVAQRGVGCG